MKFKIIENIKLVDGKLHKTYNIYERSFFMWFEAHIPTTNGLSRINYFSIEEAEFALFRFCKTPGHFQKKNTIYTFIDNRQEY